MASIILDQVTLSYPILGTERSKVKRDAALGGAGALIRDNADRTRSIVALEDISLTLQDGDRLGLIGRNGSGKSTLLRVIAGIYEPREGYIRVEGRIAGLFSIGLGMQPEATGYKNIVVAGLVAGFSREQIREKIPEIAEFCELGEYLDMPVKTYSNGMAMRLKFACATAFNADILLMDEWLGAGDPSFQEKAQARLRKLVDEAGIMILASHNHTVIKRSCNKLAWLDRGKLRAFGPVDEVLEIYDTAHLTAEEIAKREAERQQKRVEAKRERRRKEAREEIRRQRQAEAKRERRREQAREEARRQAHTETAAANGELPRPARPKAPDGAGLAPHSPAAAQGKPTDSFD